MKVIKNLILTFILCLISIVSYAQNNKTVYSSLSVGFAASNVPTGSSSSNQLDFTFCFYNIYMDCSTNFIEPIGENHYGSGGLSNNYHLLGINIGYAMPINKNLYTIPIVGVLISTQLYNDQYYGSSHSDNENSYLNCGAIIGYNYKNINFYFKGSIHQIGAGIGFIFME